MYVCMYVCNTLTPLPSPMDADRPCFLHKCVFIFPKLEDKHPEIAKNSVVPHVSLGFCKFAHRGPKCDRMGDILDRNGKLATTKNFSAISRCKSARWKKKKNYVKKHELSLSEKIFLNYLLLNSEIHMN